MQDAKAMAALETRYRASPSRDCLECTECCDTLRIPEIEKPAGQKCPNSCAAGCAIYAERYDSCKSFRCAWAMGYGKPSDRPDRSGAIADYREGRLGWKLYGLIVRDTPRAWRALNRISDTAGVDVLVD